jgi:DNA adenine methylase
MNRSVDQNISAIQPTEIYYPYSYISSIIQEKESHSLSHTHIKNLLVRRLACKAKVTQGHNRVLSPFLKWAGGKRWFVEQHFDFLPKRLNGRYIEPFLGSGAVFFALEPKDAVLSDACQDLITTYTGICDQYDEVLRILTIHSNNHGVEYYYQVRASEPKSIAERAARFIYLNRTCFNGIYRVNLNGKFNVPIGSKTKVISENDDFLGWALALRRAQLQASDFESVIDDARKSDFVFVDPPYTIRHNNNGFIKYNEVLFSWEDQLRLHDCLQRAKSRGVRILMTNANHQSLKDLYSKGFKQFVTSRYSSIAASSAKRDRYEELIIQS